ncbi:MAG: NmrA/HSCARG family protein [Bacteroidota bacterium]|nr:NmrA/HSCARG family protein [Bacteroidota bacterium]
MEPAKTIFVTGATGNQGGATARNLLSQGVIVKALVRDMASPKAKVLQEHKAELIQGDLDKPSSYAKHLANVDGVFGLLHFTKGIDKEIAQGKALIDAAVLAGVRHFIYSSVIASDQKTGIPHFESKGVIEAHLRSSGLPFTILRPSSLYENFMIPQVRSRIVKGKFVSPLDKHVVQQMISTQDIGNIAAHIFLHPEQYIGKTLDLAADQMDQGQMADSFSKAMGKNIKYGKLPGLITRLAMGKDLHTMFKYINTNGGDFIKNYKEINHDLPPVMTLSEWIPRYFI